MDGDSYYTKIGDKKKVWNVPSRVTTKSKALCKNKTTKLFFGLAFRPDTIIFLKQFSS